MEATGSRTSLPEPVRTLSEPALNSFPAVAAATWTVTAVQAVLALAILAGARLRKVVLVLGIGLHASIGLLMNLPAFGLAMTGLLVVGTIALGANHGQDGLRANARPAATVHQMPLSADTWAITAAPADLHD